MHCYCVFPVHLLKRKLNGVKVLIKIIKNGSFRLGLIVRKCKHCIWLFFASTNMTKSATVKTLKKWEAEFKTTNFSYDLSGGKVCRIRCDTCTRWGKRISSCKNIPSHWIKPRRGGGGGWLVLVSGSGCPPPPRIKPGSESISKGSVKKHVWSLQHKEAVKLTTKTDLGDELYEKRASHSNFGIIYEFFFTCVKVTKKVFV